MLTFEKPKWHGIVAGVVVVCALAAPAWARAQTPVITSPLPCVAGSCRADVSFIPSAVQVALVEVEWEHSGPAAENFRADASARCAGLGALDAVSGLLPGLPATCDLTSPPYAVAQTTLVVARLTLLGGAPKIISQVLTVTDEIKPPVEVDHCEPRRAGEQCGPGKGRRTPGGGEKVSHKGWPAISGILWQVLDSGDHEKTGGPANDELLGHHGDEVIHGAAGKDVIWGDWDPKNNTNRQVDRLYGEAGNDWIYSSHGRNTIRGGRGKDYVWAYYGRGTIDCGPGFDTLRIRVSNQYSVRNCERTKNFCSFGSKPGNQGGCYKPGERPATRARR